MLARLASNLLDHEFRAIFTAYGIRTDNGHHAGNEEHGSSGKELGTRGGTQFTKSFELLSNPLKVVQNHHFVFLVSIKGTPKEEPHSFGRT